MSLFLKIFLWFWLAIAFIVGALMIVNLSTQSEPLTRQWQNFVGEAVTMNSQTALQIYQNEGRKGLDIYLSRLSGSERVLGNGFFDSGGNQISGSQVSIEGKELMQKAFQSDSVEFQRLPEQTLVAKKITDSSGNVYVYVVQLRRPFQTNIWNELMNRWLQIAVLILTAGLVCYGLARYLSSPIGKIRYATKLFAEGDLTTRVAPKIGKRRDELADLARDFDEMAERIENLVTSQKRMAQDISHELRSPLARLNVALEIAKTKFGNDSSRPILERIENESNRLNEMIGRLLILSKLEGGVHNFDKQRINLEKLVAGIVEDADYEAKAKNKSVKFSEKIECYVFGNENLLRSAVENVLRNAVRYTKENTEVEVTLKNSGGSAKIAVRDYGDGVPEEELEKLFRPFHRVGEARERKTGGIGLGLAIAERAVHANDGKIKAENTGNGLIVEIVLPISENEE